MTLAGDMTLAAAYTTASRCSPSAVLDVSVRCRKGQETGSVAVMGVAVVVVGNGRVCSVLASSYGFEEAGACSWYPCCCADCRVSDLLHLMQISPPPYQ